MAQTAGLRRPSPVCLFGGNIPTLLYSDPAKGGDGKTRINPDKCLAKWEWIAASYNSQFPFSVPPLQTVRAHATIGAQDGKNAGDFEALSFNFRTTTGSSLPLYIQPEVRTPTLNRVLTNVNLSSNLVSGTSQMPGIFPCSIFNLPKSSVFFNIQNTDGSFTATAEPVIFGRRYDACSPAYTAAIRRRADFLRWMNPYWIGPEDPANGALTGPEVLIKPGQALNLTFPIKSPSGFLLLAFLDDSTYQGGAQIPQGILCTDVLENVSGRSFINQGATGSAPIGLDWTSFLACPSPKITGMPAGGVIRAFSLRSPLGGISNYFKRNTQVVLKFTNTDPSQTIILRPALFGYQIWAEESGSNMSADFAANQERMQQAFAFLRSIGEQGSPEFATGGPS